MGSLNISTSSIDPFELDGPTPVSNTSAESAVTGNKFLVKIWNILFLGLLTVGDPAADLLDSVGVEKTPKRVPTTVDEFYGSTDFATRFPDLLEETPAND